MMIDMSVIVEMVDPLRKHVGGFMMTKFKWKVTRQSLPK